jgi:DNA-binding transcriptional ArsR family regulator
MPKAEDRLVHVAVTPRFEIFYALQALERGTGDRLDAWRQEVERRVTGRVRASLAKIAPTPLIWPLLADALRELPAAPAFQEMLHAVESMDDSSFQRFVLSGVFKSPGSVASLMEGEATLGDIVTRESKTYERLLAYLGLHPFDPASASAQTFSRIIADPGSYRDEVRSVLESFWSSAFGDTWRRLEDDMREVAKEMRSEIARNGFAKTQSLPITIDGTGVVTRSGKLLSSLRKTKGIYLIPSAFNTSNLWTAYEDADGSTRYFIPVLHESLAPGPSPAMDPSLIFRALGDTTRYGIAASIARTPMTSLELARAFGVSKPTITHHVQLMRAAGLIDDVQTERGLELTLNRRALERLSSAACREMFSETAEAPPIKRSRRPAR